MTDVPRPQWLDDLIGLAEQLCPAETKGTRATARSRPAKNLGRVLADAEKGEGWFWLGIAGNPADSDQLDVAYLAPAEGAGQRRYQLIEAFQDGNLLRLRVGAHAPREGLFLWVPNRERGLLEKSLVEGLKRIDHFDFVNPFGSGQPDLVPTSTGAPSDWNLNPGQELAWAASRAPGVHLVWGPPGTGKTKVIALALLDLINHGKSVRLVSHANVAVDNALGRAASALNPAPGVLVRAGVPQVQAVADDSRISLQKMIHDRQEALSRQRRSLEDQITACRSDPDLARLAKAREELAGFDANIYRQAEERLANRTWLAEKVAESSQAQQLATAAADKTQRARQRLDAARSAARTAESSRAHLRTASELTAELKTRALDRDRAAADALILEGKRDQFADALRDATGLRRRSERKRLSALLAEADRRLTIGMNRRDEVRQLLSSLSLQLIPEIDEHSRAALPFTPDALGLLDAELIAAEEGLQQAEADLKTLKQKRVALGMQVDYAESQPQPTPADIEIVAWARDRNLPRKLANLPILEKNAGSILAKIEKLELQHEKMLHEISKHGREVRREIVRNASVVATTLALLRMTPELHERQYDHVIIDEVAAACPPEVVYAASRAREGVTMLGDFLQNGPITPSKFRLSNEPEIQQWYHRDCFAIFGITDSATAHASPGCVTLTEQYRFGAVINNLANKVAYRGALQVAESDRFDSEQSIILIDVDGLGDDLAQVRPGRGGSSKWWSAGAFLASALAARHFSMADRSGQIEAKKVAIVTPYRAQQELLQDVLRETGASPQIEIGTSHRFQGREFHTLIFDLVEDGTGWIARGRLDAGAQELGGLRAFNVGVTRAERYLYLIANVAAIRRAKAGPLHALRELQEAGQIHVVRAAEILGLPRACLVNQPVTPSPAESGRHCAAMPT